MPAQSLLDDGAFFFFFFLLLLFPTKRRLVGSFKLALANKYARVRQQLSPILGQIIDASIDAFAQRPLPSSALYLYLKNLQLFFFFCQHFNNVLMNFICAACRRRSWLWSWLSALKQSHSNISFIFPLANSCSAASVSLWASLYWYWVLFGMLYNRVLTLFQQVNEIDGAFVSFFSSELKNWWSCPCSQLLSCFWMGFVISQCQNHQLSSAAIS